MKTKLVRPVLVETKNKSRICHLSQKGKEFNDLRFLSVEAPIILDSINYQLIIISLDPDEKIEVGDMFVFINKHPKSDGKPRLDRCDSIHSNGSIQPFDSGCLCVREWPRKFCYKVIATQDKLSPDLINQLVAEYNNGGMQDFEIEMGFVNIHDNLKYKCGKSICYNTPLNKTLFHLEDKKHVECKVIDRNLNGWGHIQFTNYSSDDILDGGRGIYLLDLYYQKPKLTNGFVTVVDTVIGKPLEDYIYEKHNQDRCMGFIDGYDAKKLEEPINYNEEEVIRLFENWMNTKIQEELMRLSGELDELGSISFEDWFNENKKK